MSVPADPTVRVTAHVTIGGEGIVGAIVKLIDDITGREFLTTFTKSGGYTEAIDVALYGYRQGDRIRVYASARELAETKVITLYDNIFVEFSWTTPPDPIFNWPVWVTVEAMLPDPSYVGDYWIKNPEEIPIARVPLQGARVVIKDGFTTKIDDITNVSGNVRGRLYSGSYGLTISMTGYETLTTTISVAEAELRQTFLLEPTTTPDLFALDWEKYLTWSNIAKAGAVVVLVGFGSEAFKKFREAFKK